MTRRRWAWLRWGMPLAMAALAGGCQKGSQEPLNRNPIQIDTVDVRLTATDSRAGAVITSDFPPAGSPQSGPTPLAITETVTVTGQSIVRVNLTDDAVPPNRYTGGRIEIK